jgi:NAD(P)H dehydrogenase (quinone)
MTHVMLLLAHPRADSFCHALADRVAQRLTDLGHEVRSHDLYAERFDPLVTVDESYTSGHDVESHLAREPDPVIARHREELREAEGLVVVHPNWWGMPPAVLTGWIDRVVVPGVAYRLADATASPDVLSPLSRLFVVNTSDTTSEREEAMFGDPLEAIWGRCLATFLGSPRFTRMVLRPVTDASPDQRAAWLDEVETCAAEAFGTAAAEVPGG